MARQSVDRLTATERAVARTGSAGEPLTTREVAEELSVTRRAAYERLDELAERGTVETKKVGARGRVWWQPPADERETSFGEAILDVQPDLVYEYDTDGCLQRWNDRVVEVTGYDPEELAGRSVFELVHPDDREAIRAAIDDPIADDGPETMEITLVTADGEERPYEVTGTPITDDDGAVTAIAGIGRNVSERLERERQLRRERDFGDRLIEATPASIAVFDRDGTVVRANRRATERLGIESEEDATFSPGQLDIYDADGEVVPPSERPTPRAFATGEPVRDVHLQVDLPVGGTQWASVSSIPLGDGEPVERVLVAARDISELKGRAEQLERERATLETELAEVFARVDDGVLALDHERRFTFVNDRAEEILDRSAADLLGEDLLAAFPAAADSRSLEAYERAMETQSPVSVEEYYEPADAWLELTAYPSETGLSVYVRDVTERTQRQRALREQRERLAALHSLNAVVRDINEAVLQQPTRTDIEELVCERLAGTESYEFAWIGEGDAAARTIEPRVEAGVEGYVDEVGLSTAADDPAGRGPAGRALRTGETQVSTDVDTDPLFEPWREQAETYGYSAVAAIPVAHADTTYGVLSVYADRSGAFTDEERAVVAHLGDVVGHAIAAVERKRALMSDQVVELELAVPDALAGVDSPVEGSGRIVFDRAVPAGGGQFVVYGSVGAGEPAGESDSGATGSDPIAPVRALADALDHWESVSALTGDGDGNGEGGGRGGDGDDGQATRFELRLTEPPVISAIATHGGSVASAAIEDGEYHLVVHLPAGADVREFVEVVGEAAPSVAVIARRQITRDRSPERVNADLAAALTDRQRAALEASYHAGYFEWPRARDGGDVAAALDVSPPTFHQHLRAAQRKLLDALLS